MVRNIRLFLAVLLIAGLASAAIAQYEDDKPSKIGIGLINFLPMDSDLKDLRSMWMGPVIDWHLSFDEEGRPDRLVSLGFIDSGEKYIKASEEFATYTKINRTPISENRSRYIGYGGGIHRLKLRTYGYDDGTFKPSVHALYGQEFNDIYFAEIRVDLLPKWKDADWGGISLNIGTRISL
ncbi:MAG: hypothetical protein ABFD46_02585 [Armatimonadota bacterium]